MIPAVLEEGVPARLLDQDLVEQVADRPVVEAQLRPVLLDEAACRAASRPPRARPPWRLAWSSRQVAVCTAFHSETAWRTLLARTTRTKVRSGKTVGQQLGQRHVAVGGDVAQQADEVAEVAPHQLRAEDAVGGGAGLEGPLEVAVVGGAAPQRRARRRLAAERALAEVVADRLVLDAEEVLLRPPRPAAVAERLEVLLRAARRRRFPRARGRPACCRFGAWRRRVGALGLHW